MLPLLLGAGRMLAAGAVRGAATGAARGAIAGGIKESVKKGIVEGAKKKATSFIKKKVTKTNKKVSPDKLIPKGSKGGGGNALVRRKSSAIVRRPSSAIVKPVDKETGSEEKQQKQEQKPFDGGDLIKELIAIKETLIKIKGVLGSNLANSLRNQRSQRILRSKEKAAKKEAELEKKGPEKKGKLLEAPKKKLSFFDMIWNYISNVLLGSLANYLFNYVPQIIKMFEEISKGLENPLQQLRLGIITLTTLFPKQIKFLAKLTGKIIGPPAKLIGKLLLKAGGVAKNLFKKAGTLVFNLIKGPLTNLVKRIGGEALEQGIKSTAKGAAKFAGKAAAKAGSALGTGARFIKRFKAFSKLFKKVPVVGALIGIGIDMAMGEPLDRAVVGAAGAMLGSAIGGLIGTGVIPIPGVGTFVGGFIGGAIGDWGAKEIYKNLTGRTGPVDKANPIPVERHYAAGRVGGGSRTGPSRNGSIQGKPTIASGKLSADVEQKAKDDVLKDEQSLNRFKSLSSVFAGTPFVGQLLKMGIDIGMGAKVEKTQTDAAAQDLGFTIGKALEDDEFSVPGLNKRIIGPLSKNLTEWAKRKIFYEVKSREGLFPSIEKGKEEKKGKEGPGTTSGGPTPGADSALNAADLEAIKASSADKRAAAHLATLEASAPQHVADVYQVILNRAAKQSGGIAAVITAREQFSPYSAAIYGTSADAAAARKYGPLKLSKKELFDLAGKPDGIQQLTNRFNAGNPKVAAQVLSDFEKGGPLSKSSKQFVGGAQYFMGYATRVSGERRRPDGGNYIRDNYGGGYGFNHHKLPFFAMGGGGHAVTSELGMRNLAISPGMHMGVDIAGKVGEPLQAFTDGMVEATSPPSPSAGYGNWVSWIDDKGIGHLYGHMNKPPSVKAGQRVQKGTVLGELGQTGKTTGPHLHWEAATNPRDTGMPKSAVLSRFNPLSKYNKEAPFGGTIKPDGSVPETSGTPSQHDAAPGSTPPGTSGQSSFSDAALTSGTIYGDPARGGGSGTRGKIVEYLTGDPNSPNIAGKAYDRSGHGTPDNYHDHFAFSDRQTAIDAYKFFKSKGVKVTELQGFDEVKPGDHAPNSYHYSGLAFDIPGHQWGGSGPIGETEYAGSRKVRALIKEFFGGSLPAGSGPVPADIAQQPGRAPNTEGGGGFSEEALTSGTIYGDPEKEFYKKEMANLDQLRQKPSYDQGGKQSIVMLPPLQNAQPQPSSGGGGADLGLISGGLNNKEVSAYSVRQILASALYKI